MNQTERYAQIWDKTVDELVVSSSKYTKNCYFVKKCPQKLQKNDFWAKNAFPAKTFKGSPNI